MIVLRKLPYEDHSVIVNGMSPEFGRLDFIVRNGEGGIKRAFPELDLFRLLNVSCTMMPGRLNYLRSAELIESFDGISRSLERFNAASWIASFTLLNLMQQLPHSCFANAVEVAFRRLSRDKLCNDAILAGVCLSFLFEEGWLDYAMESEQSSRQCRLILEMAAGKEAPELSEASWHEQFQWCLKLLEYNECRLPA